MKKPTVKTLPFLLIWVVCLMLPSASALIVFGLGNDPVRDAGWPEGALAVANMKCRVAWWEGPPFGGGEWHFLYRGTTDTFLKMLDAFSAIRSPVVELVLHDGPEIDSILKSMNKPDVDPRVDWTFTVWNPDSWNRLYNDPKKVYLAGDPNFRQPVAPPRMDVYIGGGLLDWTKVLIPAGVHLRDDRASAAGVNPTDGALVRVNLFDVATGKPIFGAHVIVALRTAGAQNLQTAYQVVSTGVTNESGLAQLERIPAGTYRTSATADGYAPRLLGYANLGDHTFKQFTAEMARTANIRGMVTEDNGKPLKGVKVRASNTMATNGRGYTAPETLETVTDEAGGFVLVGLPVGYTQLRCSALGYYDKNDVSTIYDVPASDVVLHVGRAGSIFVTVADSQGNVMAKWNGLDLIVSVEPKDGKEIGSWAGGGKVRDDGTVEFTNVPPGEYRVTSRPNPARVDREYTPQQIIRVEPGVRTSVKIIFQRDF